MFLGRIEAVMDLILLFQRLLEYYLADTFIFLLSYITSYVTSKVNYLKLNVEIHRRYSYVCRYFCFR